jgi:hypothetical protein
VVLDDAPTVGNLYCVTFSENVVPTRQSLLNLEERQHTLLGEQSTVVVAIATIALLAEVLAWRDEKLEVSFEIVDPGRTPRDRHTVSQPTQIVPRDPSILHLALGGLRGNGLGSRPIREKNEPVICNDINPVPVLVVELVSNHRRQLGDVVVEMMDHLTDLALSDLVDFLIIIGDSMLSPTILPVIGDTPAFIT